MPSHPRRIAVELGLLLVAALAAAPIQAQQITTCPAGSTKYQIGTSLTDTATTKALNTTSWPNGSTTRTFTWASGVSATLNFATLNSVYTANGPWPRIANVAISPAGLQVYHSILHSTNPVLLNRFEVSVNVPTTAMSIKAIDIDASIYTGSQYLLTPTEI